LKKDAQPPKFINMADLSKRQIEGGIKAVLMDGKAEPKPEKKDGDPALGVKEDLASWKALKEDTELNEAVRRLQIHEMLAKESLAKPETIMKPIYKEVLHSDLDDPYLGLGKLLFDSYAFEKEDKPVRQGQGQP
jgi:hypothetical protein